MKRFLELSRAPFFTAIITPGIFGAILAYRETGHISWLRFILTIVGLVAAHAGANLSNDYFDFRLGADLNNPNRNKFSGGSPHIVEGREKARTFLFFGLASFAVALGCGLALAWIVDRGIGPVIGLAALGFALAFFYTAPPLKLVYHGWGEPAIFVAFGLLPVLGAYYVQTGALSAWPLIAGLPLSFLITNILWINEFPDYASDRDAGKRHLVVRLGLSASRYVYHGMVLAAFALIAALSLDGRFGRWGLLGLGALPFAAGAAAILHRHFREPPALEKAQGLTIATHLATGLLLCVGLWIGG